MRGSDVERRIEFSIRPTPAKYATWFQHLQNETIFANRLPGDIKGMYCILLQQAHSLFADALSRTTGQLAAEDCAITCDLGFNKS